MRLSCSRVTISDGTFSEIQIGCKMTRKPEHSDLPKQPDKELHALFEKITGENPGSVDQAVQGARLHPNKLSGIASQCTSTIETGSA